MLILSVFEIENVFNLSMVDIVTVLVFPVLEIQLESSKC